MNVPMAMYASVLASKYALTGTMLIMKLDMLSYKFTNSHEFIFMEWVDDAIQNGQLDVGKYRGTLSIDNTQFLWCIICITYLVQHALTPPRLIL